MRSNSWDVDANPSQTQQGQGIIPVDNSAAKSTDGFEPMRDETKAMRTSRDGNGKGNHLSTDEPSKVPALNIGSLPPIEVDDNGAMPSDHRSSPNPSHSAGAPTEIDPVTCAPSPTPSVSIVAVTRWTPPASSTALPSSENLPAASHDFLPPPPVSSPTAGFDLKAPRSAKMRMQELRRKALKSMRTREAKKHKSIAAKPALSESPTGVADSIPAVSVTGELTDASPSLDVELKNESKEEVQPGFGSRRRKIEEVWQFECSDSDMEPEEPYSRFFSALPVSRKKLSVDEQCEDMKIRVVRLGKCPSELYGSSLFMPNPKRRKKAVVATESKSAVAAQSQAIQTIAMAKNLVSIEKANTLPSVELPGTGCSPSSFLPSTEQAPSKAIQNFDVKSPVADMDVVMPLQKSDPPSGDSADVDMEASQVHGSVTGSDKDRSKTAIPSADNGNILGDGSDYTTTLQEASNSEGHGTVEVESSEVVLDISIDGVSTKSTVVEPEGGAAHSLPCSPDEILVESKVHKSGSEEVKKVVSSGPDPMGVVLLRQRIVALERRRLIRKQKADAVTKSNDVAREDSPRRVDNVSPGVRSRYYEDGLPSKNKKYLTGNSGASSGESSKATLREEPIPKWNEREQTNKKAAVINAADSGALKDLRSELENSKRQLSTFQDYTKVMQMASVSVAQAAAKVSFKRSRAESMAEETKKAELEAQEAEQNYEKILEAAQQMRSSIPDMPDSDFAFPDLEISAFHTGQTNGDSPNATNGPAGGSPGPNLTNVEEGSLHRVEGQHHSVGRTRRSPVDVILLPSPYSPSPDNKFISCLSASRAYVI